MLAAAKDKYLLGNLWTDPASVFVSAGYPLTTTDNFKDFNDFYRSHAGVRAFHAALMEDRPFEVPTAECVWCEVGLWTVAVAIVALAAGGVALLTPEVAPIVALAELTGVAAPWVLAFVVANLSTGFFTVETVLLKLCEWIGVC
jgi:hypothetical protein